MAGSVVSTHIFSEVSVLTLLSAQPQVEPKL